MRMHRIDQHRHVVGRRVLADAVAEVEDVAAGAAPQRRRSCERAPLRRRSASARREQHVGIEVALQRHAVADARARGAEVDGPVEPDARRRRSAAISSSHRPPPLVNTMRGTRRPSCSRFSCRSTRSRVGQAEAPGTRRRPARRPSCRRSSPPARRRRSARSGRRPPRRR